MSDEIEKKWVISENGKDYATETLLNLYSSVDELKEDVLKRGKDIIQGYMPLDKGCELSDKLSVEINFEPVEARLREYPDKYQFTLKGYGGTKRPEENIKLEESVFKEYWKHTEGNRIIKKRLTLPYEGRDLEIDVFLDRDLILAEIETETLKEANALKDLGRDESENQAYKNKNLGR